MCRAGEQTTVWPVLFGLVAVGLVLRVWGLGFGLPYAYHVDEAAFNLVARDAVESGFKQLAPNFSAFQWVVAFEHTIFRWIESAVRLLPLSPETVATLDSPSERYNLIARVTSAVLGAATAIPVYLLGARVWNRYVGVLAALFMTTCYVHVRDSHFGVPDAMVCFLTVAAAYACTRLYERAPVPRYLVAGVLCGLAVGSKQLSWPIFVLLFLFHLFAPPADGTLLRHTPATLARRALDWRFWTAAIAGVVVYLACVPQMLLNWAEFRKYWQWARTVGLGGGMDRLRIEDTGPIATYLYSLRWGIGDVLTVLSLAGLVVGLLKPPS